MTASIRASPTGPDQEFETGQPTREPGWSRAAGAVVLGVFLLVRMTLVFFCPATVNGEAGYFGEVIQDLLRGPRFPIVEYQYSHYEGGSLLMTIPGAALTALLGDAFWVLNLQGVLLSGLLLVLCLSHVKRAAGAVPALATGLLLAVPFPFQAVVTSMSSWDWLASSLFVALFLGELVAYDAAADLPFATRARMGLIAGLGFWNHLSFCSVALAPCVMPPRWVRGLARQLASLSFLGGLLAGLTPWLFYNATHGWLGLAKFAEGLAGYTPGSASPAGFPDRLLGLLTIDLPLAFGFPGRLWDARVSAYACYALVIAALGRLAVLHFFSSSSRDIGQPRVRLERLLLGYAAGYVAVAAASGFRIVMRIGGVDHPAWGVVHGWSTIHLLPLLQALCVLVALAGTPDESGAPGRPARRHWALALPVTLWLVCLTGVLQLPSTAREVPGPFDSTAAGGRMPIEMGWRSGRDAALAFRLREQFDARDRLAFAIGLGFAVAEQPYRLEPRPWPELRASPLLAEYQRRLTPDERTGLWMGIGRLASWNPELGGREEEFLALMPEDARLALRAGLCMSREFTPGGDLFATVARETGIPDVAGRLGPCGRWVAQAWTARRPFWY